MQGRNTYARLLQGLGKIYACTPTVYATQMRGGLERCAIIGLMIIDLLITGLAVAGFWLLRTPLQPVLSVEEELYVRAALALLQAGLLFLALARASRRLQLDIFQRAYSRRRDSARANRTYFTLMRLGVIVHESAHALFAVLLGGRVTEFSVFSDYRPSTRSRRSGVTDQRLGHVIYELPVGATFALRRSIAGVAPLPVGLAVIAGLLWLGGLDYATATSDPLAAIPWTTWQWYAILIVIVPIANMMLPSREDLAGWSLAALLLLLLIALVVLIAVAAGLSLLPVLVGLPAVVSILSVVLAAPIATNLLLAIIIRLLA